MLRDIQFGLPAILRAGSERGNSKVLGALREPVAEPPFLKFLNPPLNSIGQYLKDVGLTEAL